MCHEHWFIASLLPVNNIRLKESEKLKANKTQDIEANERFLDYQKCVNGNENFICNLISRSEAPTDA